MVFFIIIFPSLYHSSFISGIALVFAPLRNIGSFTPIVRIICILSLEEAHGAVLNPGELVSNTLIWKPGVKIKGHLFLVKQGCWSTPRVYRDRQNNCINIQPVNTINSQVTGRGLPFRSFVKGSLRRFSHRGSGTGFPIDQFGTAGKEQPKDAVFCKCLYLLQPSQVTGTWRTCCLQQIFSVPHNLHWECKGRDNRYHLFSSPVSGLWKLISPYIPSVRSSGNQSLCIHHLPQHVGKRCTHIRYIPTWSQACMVTST